MIRCPLYKKKSVFGKGILQRSNEVPLSLLQTLLCCFVPCHSCRGNAIHTYTGVQLSLSVPFYYAETREDRAARTGKINKIISFALRLYFAHRRSGNQRRSYRQRPRLIRFLFLILYEISGQTPYQINCFLLCFNRRISFFK